MGSLILPTGGSVYIDANAIIYSVERIEPYRELLAPMWQKARAGQFALASSELVVLEKLIKPLRELGRDGAANNRTAPAGLRHPPRRTGRAAFTASGSPSDELDRGREHRLFRHHRRVHTSLLRRSSLRSTPIRLPPFAMRPAFPTSDYYEGSAPRPALAAGWPTPSPENRTWFPSSRRLRLHAVLARIHRWTGMDGVRTAEGVRELQAR